MSDSTETPLREQIVKEIMSLVRQQPKKMERPSIAELEKILNSESTDAINIEPDGTVSITPTVTTVGAVADKVVAVFDAALAKERVRCTAIINAARMGEIDGDLRCIRSRIESGDAFPEIPGE